MRAEGSHACLNMVLCGWRSCWFEHGCSVYLVLHLCSGRGLLFVFKVEEYVNLTTHWQCVWMYLSVSGGLGQGVPCEQRLSLGSPSHTLYSSRTSVSPRTADSVRPPGSCCCLTCSVFPLTSHLESSNPFLLILQDLGQKIPL